jgi:hypothetical protein
MGEWYRRKREGINEEERWGIGCIGRGREREGMEEEERLGNGIEERGKEWMSKRGGMV